MTQKQTQYAADRQDPKWQKKRLQIMQRDEFKCTCCESEDQMLNVHHSYYISGRKPWDYPDWCFSTLCKDCHELIHSDMEEGLFYGWEQALNILTVGGPSTAIMTEFWNLISEIRITSRDAEIPDILQDLAGYLAFFRKQKGF